MEVDEKKELLPVNQSNKENTLINKDNSSIASSQIINDGDS